MKLHQAASAGDAPTVKRLLAEGSDVNARDADGRTPLLHAASQAHVDIVRLLLAAGADVNVQYSPEVLRDDREDRTGLWEEDFFGKYVLSYVLNSAKDEAGERMTALAAACASEADEERVSEVARLLLAAGADVNYANEFGQTPLMIAALSERLEVVRCLLAAGADVDAEDRRGMTAVMGLFFLDGDRPEAIVRELIVAGADVHHRDRAGRTPLMLAAQAGRLDLLALAKGLDFDVTEHGETALTGATKGTSANGYGIRLLRAAENGDTAQVRECLAHDADPNTPGVRLVTPLILAAREGHAEVVELLLAAGAHVNRAAFDVDQTPLRCAVTAGHVEIVRRLLQGGADVWPTPSGGSALHDAVRRGRDDIAELLLAAGAEANVVDDHDETPLAIAQQMGRDDLADRLLAAGAKRRADVGDVPFPLDFSDAAAMPAYAESIAQVERLCGAPAQHSHCPGLVVFTFTPDGTPPPISPCRDIESSRREIQFTKQFAEKLWRRLDAAYDDCLARGHFLFHMGDYGGGMQKRNLYLLPTAEKYEVLARSGVIDRNGLSNSQIICWLRGLERDHPFRLRGCSCGTIWIEFTSPLVDSAKIARKLSKLCPNLISNSESIQALAWDLESCPRVCLWWD